jgi:peptidoglycan/xylan/chitin deacetylase (PgdA/CDA1 family)
MELLREGRLPPDSVVLTIDDGWYGSFSEMAPRLADARLPFTLYAYTKPMVDNTPIFRVMLEYLTAVGKPRDISAREIFGEGDEVYELAAPQRRQHALNRLGPLFVDHLSTDWLGPMSRIANALCVDLEPLIAKRVFHFMDTNDLAKIPSFGGSVQLHTHMHRFFLDQPDQMFQAIKQNREVLESTIGGQFSHFCYPSGNYDPKAFPQLDGLGIETATTVEPGLVDAETHPLALPRYCLGESTDELALNLALSGVLDFARPKPRVHPAAKKAG